MHAAGSPTGAGAMEPPSPEAIRAQLGCIVASPEFAVPERLHRFLRYVVEETLAGRADRIKAYTIGIEVFGRDETFDSQAEPVVRIEAGRLRRGLERYYLTAGRDDPVLITVPKGGYIPLFALRVRSTTDAVPEAHASAPAPLRPSLWWRGSPALVVAVATALAAVLIALGLAFWALRGLSGPDPTLGASAAALPEGPVLLVAPFANLGGTPEAELYATGLTEEVLTQLARFKEITVLGRETSRSVPPRIAPGDLHQLEAGYVLEGSVRVADGHIRVTARLIDAETAAVLWANAYDEDLQLRGLFAIQESVAGAVVTAIAQPYGIVFQADARRPTLPGSPDDNEAYACTLRFYAYRAELSPGEHAEVRDCLERAVGRFPDYATAWGMLAFLYLDEDRFRFNPKAGAPAPLDQALEAARRAVALDPENARALQALMATLFFRQEVRESLRVGERALALNPNDTELLAEYGTRLAESGEWDRGAALVEQALLRNPGHSGYYRGILALCAYMRRDYDRALTEIREADLDQFHIYHGVAAIIYAELGMVVEATKAGARFARMNPGFLANLDTELAKRNFRPEDRARLVAGLRKAGVPLPARAAMSDK